VPSWFSPPLQHFSFTQVTSLPRPCFMALVLDPPLVPDPPTHPFYFKVLFLRLLVCTAVKSMFSLLLLFPPPPPFFLSSLRTVDLVILSPPPFPVDKKNRFTFYCLLRFLFDGRSHSSDQIKYVIRIQMVSHAYWQAEGPFLNSIPCPLLLAGPSWYLMSDSSEGMCSSRCLAS